MTKFVSTVGTDSTQVPPAVQGVFFLVCFAIFILGFWLMGEAFVHDSALYFVGGMLASSVAFFIPIHLRQD